MRGGGGGGGGAWPGTAPASGGLGVAAAGVGARTLLRELLAGAVAQRGAPAADTRPAAVPAARPE